MSCKVTEKLHDKVRDDLQKEVTSELQGKIKADFKKEVTEK